MTIDQAILRALESGPITVDEILRRLEAPVRTKLEKLRVRGVVMREGRGGAHRKFTFTLLHPDRAGTALKEKGGLAPESGVRCAASPATQCDWKAATYFLKKKTRVIVCVSSFSAGEQRIWRDAGVRRRKTTRQLSASKVRACRSRSRRAPELGCSSYPPLSSLPWSRC
jgi:hypothetical protein